MSWCKYCGYGSEWCKLFKTGVTYVTVIPNDQGYRDEIKTPEVLCPQCGKKGAEVTSRPFPDQGSYTLSGKKPQRSFGRRRPYEDEDNEPKKKKPAVVKTPEQIPDAGGEVQVVSVENQKQEVASEVKVDTTQKLSKP